MTAPNLAARLPLPSDGEIPETYSDLLKKLECTCTAGAKIKPSTLPSATVNLGDIIADQTRILGTFTSMYSVIAVVLRMISCIIDVICALVNPFSLIFAIIRLFGSCLPDFILIFPQLAVPAKIICVIKIILAIVDYVLNVIVPIIEEIIDNINNLINAITNNNPDAQAAIAFKIAALFKEIFNIIGILNALIPIFEMIMALMNMGISLPCSGSGGSCSGCADEVGGVHQCPSIIQQTSINGNDGQMIVLFGSDLFVFKILFYSSSSRNDFLTLKDFFPRGLDYDEIRNTDDLPYTLIVDGNTYAVTSVDSGGYLNLSQILPEMASDGYFSSTTGSGASLPDPTKDVRLGTPTGSFTPSMAGSRYVTIQDTNGSNVANSGTWLIFSVYDSNNVVLRREDGGIWITSPQPEIYWRVAPSAPPIGIEKIFKLEINHAELIRHNLINLGCHPAVKATINGVSERYGAILDAYDTGLSLPTTPARSSLPDGTPSALPDLNGIINVLNSCVAEVVPLDVDSQYILDNYNIIKDKIPDMASCIENNLNNFRDELLDYGQQIYPRLFDPETTIFTATPLLQIVGRPVNVRLFVYDRYGEALAKGFSSGFVDVDILTTEGIITTPIEMLDSYGATTGEFTAILNSDIPTIVTLTAKVANIYVSDFDGYNLNPREVQVEFITTTEMQRRSAAIEGEVSVEPLGKVG
jgi:hypothetical protein